MGRGSGAPGLRILSVWCFKKTRLYFLRTVFRFTAKLWGKYRVRPTPCASTRTASPSLSALVVTWMNLRRHGKSTAGAEVHCRGEGAVPSVGQLPRGKDTVI